MAASYITINAVTTSGEPIDVLNNLIQKRAAVMNQTTEKACIAITIQVLKSLRALTKKGNGKLKPFTENEPQSDLDIQLKHRPDLVVSHIRNKGKIIKPCVRIGNKHGDVFNGLIWWRSGLPLAGHGTSNLKVYQTTISQRLQDAWHKKAVGYIVAKSEADARKWAEWRFGQTAKKSSSLAKTAISRAMMLTSDRPATLQIGNRQNVLTNNVIVKKNLSNGNTLGTDGNYSITVSDNLNYAIKSLKGGQGAITTAMARSANSVNANINRFIEKHPVANWFSDENWQTADAPFPKEWFDNN